MSENVQTKARGCDAMCNDGANPAAAIYTARGREKVKQERLRAKPMRPKGTEASARANIFTRTREGPSYCPALVCTRHGFCRRSTLPRGRKPRNLNRRSCDASLRMLSRAAEGRGVFHERRRARFRHPTIQ
jgi:hypothetical protein